MAPLLFSGPATGAQLVASTPFTVRMPPGTSLLIPGTVTPSDAGAGGTFTPVTATMPVGQGASCTFTYTPAGAGALTISMTNSFSATNPSALTYLATGVIALSLSGPASGALGLASTPFTIALPAGVGLVGPGSITPTDNGALGTFSPPVVVFAAGVGVTATFTFTPAVQGPLTLSLSSNFGGTLAAALAYQVGVTASFGTNPALTKNPGSSDTVPVYYPVQRTVQRLFNQGSRYIPYYASVVLQTPTYAPMDVRGPSTLYRDQVNRFGLVAMKIVYCRVGARFAPTYVTVDSDGLLYKIAPFQVVTVPRNVYDLINASSDYGAVIVP